MQTKEDYLTGVYKLFGAAITVPFGRLFLAFPDLEFSSLNIQLLAYFLISIILFIIGIITLLSGYDLVHKKGNQ